MADSRQRNMNAMLCVPSEFEYPMPALTGEISVAVSWGVKLDPPVLSKVCVVLRRWHFKCHGMTWSPI
jgi:hypothetical protein